MIGLIIKFVKRNYFLERTFRINHLQSRKSCPPGLPVTRQDRDHEGRRDSIMRPREQETRSISDPVAFGGQKEWEEVSGNHR